MVATKGRASYFKEDSKGYIDPGAQSMVYILNALMGDESMTTIVLVSHSADIAKGTKDLLEQMVNNVDIKAHGGTEDGSIGTSFDEIQR